MALSFSPAEPANPVDSDYASWKSEQASFAIRIHLDVIDGIRRDVLEHPAEATVGLFRGHLEEASPQVAWIEQYQRLTDGNFELDDTVLGAYWATVAAFPQETRPPEAGSFLLSITGESSDSLSAQVLLRGSNAAFEPQHPLLSFQGRAIDDAKVPHLHGVRGRRLVPDFDLARSSSASLPQDDPERFRWARKYWPFLLAAILTGGAVLLFALMPSFRSGQPGVTARPDPKSPVRPLGLYVDASQPQWRVFWNRDATVLQGARGVRLFVRDSDDQGRVDLSLADLESGTWQYQPKGRDVTFRLEATGKDGQLAAESFRLLQTGPPEAATPPVSQAVRTPPKATHRVAAVISAGIRSRISGKIPIDIRVQVDSHGRVTSAVPLSNLHNGVEKYLADRASHAAMEWKFKPATENGEAVSGTQMLHFVFQR